MHYEYEKMQNLKLLSNPLKNLHKISCKKSYQRKNDRKVESFTFITKVFSLKLFMGELSEFIWHFFNGYELSTNLAFYDIHIKISEEKNLLLLTKALFANSKAKIG
jgi:hypothetical protein